MPTKPEKPIRRQSRLPPFTIDSDIFIDDYYLEPSWFDLAARWYGEKSWLQKQILHAEVLSVCAVLGAFNLIALIIIAVYYAVIYALMNHYDKDSNRCTRMESRLAKTQQHVNRSLNLLNNNQEKFFNFSHEIQQNNETLAAHIEELDKIQSGLYQETQLLIHDVSEFEKGREAIKTGVDILPGVNDLQQDALDGMQQEAIGSATYAPHKSLDRTIPIQTTSDEVLSNSKQRSYENEQEILDFNKKLKESQEKEKNCQETIEEIEHRRLARRQSRIVPLSKVEDTTSSFSTLSS